MTSYSGKIFSELTMLQTVLLICIFIIQVNAFSLNNCTVKGALNDTDQLKVLCYKMGFYAVPAQIPNKVRYLDISFNNIFNIKVREFKDMWNMGNLNLSDNNITWVQDSTFKQFDKLTSLNLANNKLKRLSRGLLQGLMNLQELRLDGNRIEDIEPNAFNSLLHLKLLNLSNNCLKQIDKIRPVLSSPSLEELFIGANNIDVFNSNELSTMSLSLTKIDISYNPLTTFQITKNIFPTLQHLDMSYCGQNRPMLWNITDTCLNSVTMLYLSGVQMPPESIAALLQNTSWPSLYKLRLNNITRVKVEALVWDACSLMPRVLRLQYNKISELTEHMFESCSNLTELDLADNEISYTSAFIFKGLTHLKQLHLQVNCLAQVNASFQMLPTLEFLDLSRNRLKVLTCLDFANLTQLKSLYLYANILSEISPCVFKDLNNLEILKLGSNKLLTISHVFENGLPSLKVLQLSDNKLSTLTNGTFKGLSHLISLVISDNQISNIEVEAFSGLASLTNLFLSSNKLTKKSIRDPAVFLGMPNLANLELFSNFIQYKDAHLTVSPFTNLGALKIMSIHSQRRGFGILPSNLLKGLSSLEMFYGGSMNLNNLHPDTFKYTPNLHFLELSKNAFSDYKSIPPDVFDPIPKLSKLILSRSQIYSLNFLLNANLSRLSVLKASDNMLDVINQSLIESFHQLKYLDLENNMFTCDCSNAFFLNWAISINSTQVIYLNRYTCSYPPSIRGTSFMELNTESCTENTDFICFIVSFVMVIFTLLVTFIYQFLHWHVIYAYYLFLSLLVDSKKKRLHQQHGFQYDAFISYNAQDEPWVVEELLPHLEGEQGWKLCLHYRDFEPGKPIIDNILDGIYSSRKTICLITHNYLRSNWCSKEIQMANFRLFDEQKDVLILVFLEDIPTHQLSPYHQMRKLVKKKTYLKWPKHGENTTVFWQKLRLALETKNDAKDESAILSGLEHHIELLGWKP